MIDNVDNVTFKHGLPRWVEERHLGSTWRGH